MTGANSDYGCSFAIMTVVPEAHECFRSAVGDPAPVESDGYYWTVADVEARDGGTHRVVEAQAPQRSNLAAEEFAARILRVWRPRYFLVADIGGGIHGGGETPRDGLALGDVVVAESLHYYELAKLLPDPENPRRERYVRWQPISPRLSTVGRELDIVVPDWRERITVSRPRPEGNSRVLLGEIVAGDELLPEAHAEDGDVKLLPGEIVVGEKLLADPDAEEVRRICEKYDKALAVDMESVGAAVSALSASDDGLALSYAVLRGISDWMDRRGNQETRDAWKPYAADAAVAAALALVAAIPSTVTGVSQEETDSIAELRQRIAAEYEVPDETYPSVVSGPVGVLSRNDVLATATRQHGVLLAGEAGLGKTALLLQAARAAFAPLEPFPVFVDLKRWKPEYATGLAEDPSGERLKPSMDALLRASVQGIGIDLLEKIAADREVLVLVDGINEVPYAEVAPRILTLLQEYMRARPTVHVVVTDRRPGDVYREQHWTELTLRRLEAADVEQIVDSHLGAGTYEALPEHSAALLRIPYFLDRAVRSGNPAAASRSDAMASFLHDQVGLTSEETDGLACIAYSVYETLGGRTFPADLLDQGLSRRLRDSGVLVAVADGEVRFDHQLEHDYLASRHLAADERRWTTPAFDAVTFEAASFDAIALALEQVTREQRDGFLTQVYNWNWIGAIMALADVEQDGADACTVELRTALLAVVAEKRFDRLVGTRERAERQLRRFHDHYAQRLAAALTLEELISVVGGVSSSGHEWFEDWRTLFAKLPATPLEERDVFLLADPSAVFGWTAANVIRRFPSQDDRALQVRTIYAARPEPSETSRAARWRAVHALGAWPSADNAALLLRAIDCDEYSWVKYGAARSAVEMAARTRDQDLRMQIFSGLQERVRTIASEPLSQLASSAIFDGADLAFVDAVRPVLHAALEAQRTETDRERWKVRIARFEEYWTSQLTS